MKLTVRNSIIALLLLAPTLINAQQKPKQKPKKEPKDEYTYQIIRNEPDQVKNLRIGLEPLYADVNGFTTAFGFGINAKYNMNNRFSFGIRYDREYFDLANKGTDFGESAVPITPFYVIEGSAEYYFKNELREKTINIAANQQGNIVYVVPVKANDLPLSALRFNFTYLNSYVSGNNADFQGYDINDASKTVVDLGKHTYGLMMQEGIIGIGYSRTLITDLLVRFDKYGDKEQCAEESYYADILIAPAISYSNVNIKNTGPTSATDPFITYYVNDNSMKSRFGIRAGFTASLLKPVGFGYGLEIGSRPGPDITQSLYLMGRFHVMFNAKI
jgi:hypothetical protein